MSKKKIAISIVAIIISVGLALFMSVGRYKIEDKNIQNLYNFINVEKGNVLQTVNIDGTVVATQEVDLRFQASGVIEEINFKIGDGVEVGDVLAKLNSSDQAIAVRQRQASLSQASANLNLKLEGSSSEDIAVYEARVDNAKKIVETTKNSTLEDIKNAEARISMVQVSLDDAIVNLKTIKDQNDVELGIAYENAKRVIDASLLTIEKTLDDVNDILEDNDLEDVFSVKNTQYRTESYEGYRSTLMSFEEILNKASDVQNSNYNEVDNCLSEVKIILNDTKKLLDSVFNGLVSTITSAVVSQTTLETYKTTINSFRIGVNTAISNTESKEQLILLSKTSSVSKVSSANFLINTTRATLDLEKSNLNSVKSKSAAQNVQVENSLKSFENELALKISRPRDVDIAYLKAKVYEASASVALARENLKKTSLFSPVTGTIVDIEFEVGESINSSNIFIKLTANDKKIEAEIPEIEVGKVSIGDNVEIVLDAFINKVFEGKIISIDPVETTIQGVVYYKADIAFNDATSSRIVLPGMTSDIQIFTNYRENVLNLPGSAVKKSDDSFYIQTFVNDEIKLKDVEVGLVGDDKIEIVAGAEVGEKVVDFILKLNEK